MFIYYKFYHHLQFTWKLFNMMCLTSWSNLMMRFGMFYAVRYFERVFVEGSLLRGFGKILMISRFLGIRRGRSLWICHNILCFEGIWLYFYVKGFLDSQRPGKPYDCYDFKLKCAKFLKFLLKSFPKTLFPNNRCISYNVYRHKKSTIRHNSLKKINGIYIFYCL